MHAVGIRPTRDGTDFIYFAISEKGLISQGYEGVDGLHKVLGILRAEELFRLIEDRQLRENARELPDGYMLVLRISVGKRIEYAFGDGHDEIFDEGFDIAEEAVAAAIAHSNLRTP